MRNAQISLKLYGVKSRSLQPVQHLPLHPVLELPSPDHGGQNPLDGLLGIFLLSEVLHDGVVRHLAADCEPFLQLLLNFVLEVLIFLGGETFGSRQVTRLGSRQRGDLEHDKIKVVVIRVVNSHWSRNVDAWFSLVERFRVWLCQ